MQEQWILIRMARPVHAWIRMQSCNRPKASAQSTGGGLFFDQQTRLIHSICEFGSQSLVLPYKQVCGNPQSAESAASLSQKAATRSWPSWRITLEQNAARESQ